jgi:hypothetical protein
MEGLWLSAGDTPEAQLATKCFPIVRGNSVVTQKASQPPSFPGTRSVDTRKLLPAPGGRQHADPAKLARHGLFDWAKYRPIVVEQTKGGIMYILDGMTRVENAQRAGILFLPAIVHVI